MKFLSIFAYKLCYVTAHLEPTGAVYFVGKCSSNAPCTPRWGFSEVTEVRMCEFGSRVKQGLQVWMWKLQPGCGGLQAGWGTQ